MVEVEDRASYVVLDQVGVDGDGRRGAGAGGGDHLGPRVGHVARDPDPVDARASGGVGHDPALVVDVAAEPEEEGVVRYEAGRHEQRVAGHDTAVGHLYAAEPVVVDDELLDGALDDADGARDELRALGC